MSNGDGNAGTAVVLIFVIALVVIGLLILSAGGPSELLCQMRGGVNSEGACFTR